MKFIVLVILPPGTGETASEREAAARRLLEAQRRDGETGEGRIDAYTLEPQWFWALQRGEPDPAEEAQHPVAVDPADLGQGDFEGTGGLMIQAVLSADGSWTESGSTYRSVDHAWSGRALALARRGAGRTGLVVMVTT